MDLGHVIEAVKRNIVRTIVNSDNTKFMENVSTFVEVEGPEVLVSGRRKVGC